MKSGRSILKGALAGFVGGLAGAAGSILAGKLVPAHVHGEPVPHPSPMPHPSTEQQRSPQALHWAFGAVAGAAYGAMMEYRPPVSVWRGAAFGVTVNKLTHRSLLTALNSDGPVDQQISVAPQTSQARVSEWFTHVVYGLTTEITRRAVRKRL
ncbi:putative membrane protein [Acidipila rosea]|uniref:Putative membrane protein n=1 Tax=Acidipila rosea TaxID=768535 RepID=A0A4R1LEJ1_9BACT|nr:putative membrane protein [Acidipila rosea]